MRSEYDNPLNPEWHLFSLVDFHQGQFYQGQLSRRY